MDMNNIPRKDFYLKDFLYKKDSHKFYTLPWSTWILSLVFLILASFITYLNVFKVKSYNRSYLSIIGSLILWLILLIILYSSKIEVINIDKKKGIISKAKLNIFCSKKENSNYISHITNIEIILKGYINRSTNTSKYYVRISFSNNNITFGETMLLSRVIEKYKICIALIRTTIVDKLPNDLIKDETYDFLSYDDYENN
jgi:hypothetical protein